ncbi:DUF2637 domain-containing protein [Streptomyces sp. NPDC096032]|uniref:DUF2637 domain-containing protein n=1 Tax=Streptomyces sp. NPDC096032 TaxID=3366070 RepID=UPI003826114C
MTTAAHRHPGRRPSRLLIAAVAATTSAVAGIGFTGSYAAVRELAIKKGFGNFSYVFPIGIDAGICVLLALDLLLTWIRIPLPLLRQTAWLLTAATIAFNGAAAWPDPLGVGMHAVIPVLFVVAVEAARHAIGRIADITADKHMEGVRITRWLLSPVPTFLLWRRMKLWELRSYDQVIKLEQERLVYQARLRSRFGRAWRRKAPVESLMPLRLARYGVPLAKTAPAGLAAAGQQAPTAAGGRLPQAPPATATLPAHSHRREGTSNSHGLPKPAADLPRHELPRSTSAALGPTAKDTGFLRSKQAENDLRGKATAGPRTAAADTQHRQRAPSAQPSAASTQGSALTVVDRYFLAWTQYRREHGWEPSVEELSRYLDTKGTPGRKGTPVSPSALRRYTLGFRIYTVWAQHRERTTNPPPLDVVARDCTAQGITGQYNKPITTAYLTGKVADFERRRNALAATSPSTPT